MFGFVICLALVGDVQETTVETTPVTMNETTDAARKFRIRVYNQLREERPTYDNISATGQQVLRLSERLPAFSDWHQEVVTWYDSAAEAVGLDQPLPPIPAIPESAFENVAERGQESLTTPISSPSHSRTTPRAPAPPTPTTTPTTNPQSTGVTLPSTGQGSILKTLGGLFVPGATQDATGDTQAEIERP